MLALPAQQPDALPQEVIDETCGTDPSWICQQVLSWTNGNEFAARTADFVLAKPLKIIVILVVAWVVRRLLRKGIDRLTDRLSAGKALRNLPGVLAPAPENHVRASARARTIGDVLGSGATVVIYGMAFLMVLGELGINLGPLIAGAGIAGVAIGFGAQSLVKDFLSGIFMLIEDQYGVGDVIDVGEATGTVEQVSLRSTRLRDVNGTVWHVPNGTIARVGNKSQQWARALIDISVAYSTDVRHAQNVIKEVADGLWHDPEWGPRILEEPEVWGVEMLGADGIDIRLVIKTLPAEQWKVMRELRARLKEAFDREDIEIPFPQRTMWIRHEGDGDAKPLPLDPPDGDTNGDGTPAAATGAEPATPRPASP